MERITVPKYRNYIEKSYRGKVVATSNNNLVNIHDNLEIYNGRCSVGGVVKKILLFDGVVRAFLRLM